MEGEPFLQTGPAKGVQTVEESEGLKEDVGTDLLRCDCNVSILNYFAASGRQHGGAIGKPMVPLVADMPPGQAIVCFGRRVSKVGKGAWRVWQLTEQVSSRSRSMAAFCC